MTSGEETAVESTMEEEISAVKDDDVKADEAVNGKSSDRKVSPSPRKPSGKDAEGKKSKPKASSSPSSRSRSRSRGRRRRRRSVSSSRSRSRRNRRRSRSRSRSRRSSRSRSHSRSSRSGSSSDSRRRRRNSEDKDKAAAAANANIGGLAAALAIAQAQRYTLAGGFGAFGSPLITGGFTGGGGGQQWRPGDWQCAACRSHNFASRARCFQCMAEKPFSAGTAGGPDSMFRSSTAAAAPPANFKPGDWLCQSCRTHNFASRTQCFRCGIAKQ
eukprot:jgi/Botrbrau1/6505/Bobra.0034s0078.1